MAQEELVVSLADVPVGRLTATRGGARFAYSDDVVQEYAGRPGA